MSINEEKLIVWMDQTDKKLAHLEANQAAIINGNFWGTNTEPKEPLIKDEKIRKALRNYAEAFNWESARYSSVNNSFVNQGDMFFVRPSWELEQLERLGYIPIAELCGEEEE